jgi:hypothetical protein
VASFAKMNEELKNRSEAYQRAKVEAEQDRRHLLERDELKIYLRLLLSWRRIRTD